MFLGCIQLTDNVVHQQDMLFSLPSIIIRND